jgi:ABC-type glutathione transport system ATPase component
MSATPIIQVERVSKRFVKPLDLAARIAARFGADVHEEVVHAVDDVSFEVRAGEVRARFQAHVGADGANFMQPCRIDLLRR